MAKVPMTLSDYRRAESDGIGVKYFIRLRWIPLQSIIRQWGGHGPDFGQLLTDGNYSSGSYRFGFQGQEMDNEIKGTGNSINFKYRMHNPRIGRFFALDPIAAKFPHNSPYAFSENRVIDGIELEGLEWAPYDAEGNRLDITQDGWKDNVYEYKWEGYQMEYEWDNGFDPENPGMPTGAHETDIPMPGTVPEAQVNFTDGETQMEYAIYYGTENKQPIEEIYFRAPWMRIARSSIGTDETTYEGVADIREWIDQNNRDFNYPNENGEYPICWETEEWCGVFVYYSLKSTGLTTTASNRWVTPAYVPFYSTYWNERTRINTPTYGAIAVMVFDHVAFIHKYNDRYVWILGGNQRVDGSANTDDDGTVVNIRKYPISQVRSMWLPSDYRKPPKD